MQGSEHGALIKYEHAMRNIISGQIDNKNKIYEF